MGSAGPGAGCLAVFLVYTCALPIWAVPPASPSATTTTTAPTSSSRPALSQPPGSHQPVPAVAMSAPAAVAKPIAANGVVAAKAPRSSRPPPPPCSGPPVAAAGLATAAAAVGRSSSAKAANDLLTEMLHGRKAITATAAAAAGASSAAAPAAVDGGGGRGSAATTIASVAIAAAPAGTTDGVRLCSMQLNGAAGGASDRVETRPRKRPCLPLVAAALPLPPPPAAAAAVVQRLAAPESSRERRPNLVCLLQARSMGRLNPRGELWWWKSAGPRLEEVGCWNAAEGLRAVSVVHQDAVTQIEISGETDGRACLAVAQANELVRIVPYNVLRNFAEVRRIADREVAVAREDGDTNGDDSDGGDDDDDDEEEEKKGHLQGTCVNNVNRRSHRRRRRQPQTLPWLELVHAGRIRHPGGGGGYVGQGGDSGAAAAGARSSSSVLTLNTRSRVACIGWDPQRRGRLAVVDRSSSCITLLDLGWGPRSGGGEGGAGTWRMGAFTRSQLMCVGGGDVGGGAAARAMAYLKYGSPGAPYTLAAAGRAGGEGAVVHLWDERRGSQPISRLMCPGGASLVARMEPSLDARPLGRTARLQYGSEQRRLQSGLRSTSPVRSGWQLGSVGTVGGGWIPAARDQQLDDRPMGSQSYCGARTGVVGRLKGFSTLRFVLEVCKF
ncbi:hypothetical protein VOLCADRAFT_100434 [Volvox carteri f. nagariensis]|uniref:Uncharacterized protein n=1 Tax=Volvox carteri f. nagariensis TaxID=3068 RepID=D8UK72_VOLCA|nr:uncharacterized protein VOLCADRAFT_100434 [Volvox carteri f. nagariensis]EFJ39876.1 hypothetical protein VOLCADRAFT_100434 [Volvox carteri f. nagariensis]|eukprot:XP_002959053.1 hypothetical protein VOLCADRAFT_100434 [Volvox carteri f. nagariensis]